MNEATNIEEVAYGILTVGELRRMLAHLDSDTHVVIDDGDGGWKNVAFVAVPDDDAFCAFSLFAGDEFDSRQI